ncbi:MAG: hypothetical protein BWX92_03160 [Deltaproteobacteria bacterium ADurb.Bin135]|jgi:hypothetical protein|nr:MAG: hypothetical protein BWX92_03160 [Deltaproteobacteria bacterium ADurb.Bin135]
MKKIISILVIVLVACVFAYGFVSSYSNLYGGYPSFSSKAYKPSKPFSTDSYSIERYKRDVNQYVDDANNYITAANNDIRTIQQEIINARTEANNVVNEYNRYINYGF